MFNNTELRNHIEETLNSGNIQIPDGHKGMFITYLDDAGLRTAVATKFGNNWAVEGEVGWASHNDGLEYGITVMKTW